MRVGSVVWISVERGISDGCVIEIESKQQQLVRVRDSLGRIYLRHVTDLYVGEIEALRARYDEELHWAAHYRMLANECVANVERLHKRLILKSRSRVLPPLPRDVDLST